ncbi:integrin alpha-8-like isoform X2 [Ptychodera flava]
MSFTPEQGEEYDNRYLGYSMAVGQFTHDYFEDYVVGAPKGNDLKGLVHVYDGRSTLNRPFRQISGEQLGSYFGSTVAATDVNGDGLDDIIVGAPYYSDRESANEKWEAGRVYVFYQDPNYDYGEPTRLTGQYSSGRFGSDVAAIGDVNQDGYNDIAVGGPYDGVNGNGAVYVYHGSAEGIRTQPAQVITPGDIMQNLTTFGSSLSGGLDMDNNQYPDILVGAYGSDHAVLLRSRPVVNVEPTVTINPEFIDLEKKTCAKADGTPVACFDLTTCFKHTGVNVPVALELSFTTVLDTAKEHQKRAYFQATTSTKHTEVIKLEAPDQKWCAYTKIFLRDVFTDQYTPIAMEMTYELVENGATIGPNGLTPVLNQYDPLKVKTQAYIQNNCGDDRICIPDLKLDAKIDADEIYLGSTEPVKLIVDLTNNGEDAFEWEVVVQLPPGFDYDGKEKLDNTEYIISCVHVREETGMTLYCNTESGNPLQTNHRVLFALTLSTARMKEADKVIDVVITTNSTNPEEPNTMQDNVVYQSLPVKVAADVSFTGYSVPERITYKPRPLSPDFLIEHEDDIGPEVNHVYEVRNLGPSAIDGARIEIHWPAYTPNGEHLLYLLDVQLLGGSACDTHGILNPENVKTNGVVVTTNMTKRATIIRAERHRRAENLEKAKFSVDCKSAKCVPIVCNVDFALKTDEVANVQIRARLWKDTLIKAGHDETDIRSVANVEVNSMPYNIVPDYFPSGEAEILSIALPVKPKPRTLPVPIWVIIVAIICGLLILALIIFVMWKTGFFKRKRVQDNYKEDAQNKTNDGVATKTEIVGKTEKSPPPVAL